MNKKNFRLQYASDLHLEFQDKNEDISFERFIQPVAQYLALCGDICLPERPIMISFLSWCSKNFKEVFWVPGNHEFYNYKNKKITTYNEKIQLCETICQGFSNVHFMNRKVRQIPGWNVRVAGCTMWTDITHENDEKVMNGMNDINQIYINENEVVTPSHFRTWHSQDKEWLEGEINRAAVAQEDMIILTHHLPSFKLINQKYHGHPLNFCFASNLEQMMKPPVRAWLCGHSHCASDIDISGVKCSLNPFGYPGEPNTSFDSKKVLEFICDCDALPSYGYCECEETCECDESCYHDAY